MSPRKRKEVLRVPAEELNPKPGERTPLQQGAPEPKDSPIWRALNREERHIFACMRHRPPVPIVKVIITAPGEVLREQATRLDLGMRIQWQGEEIKTVLCAVCHQPPQLAEIPDPDAPRQPKLPSQIWTPEGPNNLLHRRSH